MSQNQLKTSYNNNSKIQSKSSTVNLLDKAAFYKYQLRENIFSHTELIIVIFAILLLFLGYVLYYYFYKIEESNIYNNSSYYGKNISTYEPIFKSEQSTISNCIKICDSDITCDGITFNNRNKMCEGTKEGLIRNENSDYSAWVKPKNKRETSPDVSKAVLVGFVNFNRIINGDSIRPPYILGNFAYSFNLIIHDFYQNYGVWRHLFHKGTDISPGTIFNYQSWENLIQDIPKQTIGLWLAPFNNNLRIAVTTTSLKNKSFGSYQHAFVQKCDSNIDNNCFITDSPSGKWVDTSRNSDGSNPKTEIVTYVEFFDHDLQNIPLNKNINITINFRNKDVEIYINGKIIKINQLDGTPIFDKSNLYILNDKTVKCDINNLLYYPETLKITDINNIMTIKPTLE